MAPEQALDASQADIRADLYSLACTLYSLLTGNPPFQEETVVKLVMAHMEKEAPALDGLRSDVPRELAEMMRRMLAKDPADRFQTPVEVAQALAPFCKAVPKTSMTPKIKPVPRSEVPPNEDSPFAEIRESVSSPRKERRSKVQPAAAPKTWWLVGGIVASVLLIGLVVLLGSGIFKGTTKAGTLGSGEQNKLGIRPEPKPEKGDVISNSIGMKLVYIPKTTPGTFRMGSPKEEKDRKEDEDEHEVEITKGFYLGMYEVTQGEYETVMKENPSYFSAQGDGNAKVKGLDTSRFPVENVSYEDAKTFCAKLSEVPEEKQKKRLYRLPTEAEWEYACRGGAASKTPFHFGKSISPEQANFNNKLGQTCEVGSYKPNGFGLYDMHGNVWEWCSDWYAADYYGKSPRRDPQGSSSGGSSRVFRGGGWKDPASYCTAAFRYPSAPANTFPSVGFRLLAVPSGPE